MDTRTRVERKIDKMWAQKRRMMDIEARMKAPLHESMESMESQNNENKENQENNQSGSDLLPKGRRQKAKYQRKPRVQMSRKKETQTLIQLKSEFHNIGSGRPSLKADSAGHKLDANYRLRMDQRLLLVAALTDTDVPRGSKNALSVATRIESAIFRILRTDKDYFKYCNLVSSYLRSCEHKHIRHSLLMGWTLPEDFAFVPSVGTEFRVKILQRLRTRDEEENSKLEMLQRYNNHDN